MLTSNTASRKGPPIQAYSTPKSHIDYTKVPDQPHRSQPTEKLTTPPKETCARTYLGNQIETTLLPDLFGLPDCPWVTTTPWDTLPCPHLPGLFCSYSAAVLLWNSVLCYSVPVPLLPILVVPCSYRCAHPTCFHSDACQRRDVTPVAAPRVHGGSGLLYAGLTCTRRHCSRDYCLPPFHGSLRCATVWFAFALAIAWAVCCAAATLPLALTFPTQGSRSWLVRTPVSSDAGVNSVGTLVLGFIPPVLWTRCMTGCGWPNG